MVIAAIIIICAIMSYDAGKSVVQQEAIERGYAQHSPITGDWEWLESPVRREAEDAGE